MSMKVTFAAETFVMPITQEIVFLTTVGLYINRNAHIACDINFIVKGEGLLKVTGSHVHVHCTSDTISEAVLDRDVVTIGH